MAHIRKSGEACTGRFFQDPVSMQVKCSTCREPYTAPPPRQMKNIVASVQTINEVLAKRRGENVPQAPSPKSLVASMDGIDEVMAKNAGKAKASGDSLEALQQAALQQAQQQTPVQQTTGGAPTPAAKPLTSAQNELQLVQENAALKARIAELEGGESQPKPKGKPGRKKKAEPAASEPAAAPAKPAGPIVPNLMPPPTPGVKNTGLLNAMQAAIAEGQKSKQETAGVAG